MVRVQTFAQSAALGRLLHNGALRTVTGLRGLDRRLFQLMRHTLQELYIDSHWYGDADELPALRKLRAGAIEYWVNMSLPALEDLEIGTTENDCERSYRVDTQSLAAPALTFCVG